MATCAFPGCTRPAAPAPASGGRPSRYCILPEHNRTTAFRARTAQSAKDGQEEGERPVSIASARLRVVAEALGPMLSSHREALAAQVEAALDALDDLGDPGLVEAEVSAVRAEAMRRSSDAESDADTARAEAQASDARAAEAEAERDRAVEAQAAAVAERDALQGRLESLQRELDEAVQKAGQTIGALQQESARLSEELAAEGAGRADAEGRAERAESESTGVRGELASTRQSLKDAVARAEGAEARSTSLRDQLDAARQEVTEKAAAAAAAQAGMDAARRAEERAVAELRRVEDREVARADREIERIEAWAREQVASLGGDAAQPQEPSAAKQVRGRGARKAPVES